MVQITLSATSSQNTTSSERSGSLPPNKPPRADAADRALWRLVANGCLPLGRWFEFGPESRLSEVRRAGNEVGALPGASAAEVASELGAGRQDHTETPVCPRHSAPQTEDITADSEDMPPELRAGRMLIPPLVNQTWASASKAGSKPTSFDSPSLFRRDGRRHAR